MERLTKNAVSVQGIYKTCCVNFNNLECCVLEGDCSRCSTNDKVWEKLAEYEDLQEHGQIFDPVEMAKIAMIQIELKKYKEAEAEGRLVVLPCRVGDKIFGFRRFVDKPWEIYESIINEIRIGKTGVKIYGTKTYPISPSDIDGVDLFDNLPEAEATLYKRNERKQ